MKQWNSMKEGFKGMQMVSNAACPYSAKHENLGILKKSVGFVSWKQELQIVADLMEVGYDYIIQVVITLCR